MTSTQKLESAKQDQINRSPRFEMDTIDFEDVNGRKEIKCDTVTAEQQSNLEDGDMSPASSAPNGGFEAWMQTFDTFLLWFAGWGLVNSFGVFQTYYTTTLFPGTSPSRISWIGSLQVCIFIVGSVIVGPLYDTGHLRILLVIGTFLIVFGMVLTSVQSTYAGVILSQGLCMGLGMTCIFIPLVSVLPPYFSTRKSIAMGIAAAGSSVGAIIFVIVFEQLIIQVGFGWTTRTIALILFVSLVWPMFSMRKRVSDSTGRALIDKSALREPAFILVMCAVLVVFMGLYVPYFYIDLFAQRNGVLDAGLEYLSKYLIVILNIGSLIGRLLPNLLADRIGPWNTLVLSCGITGVIAFCWITVSSQSELLAFCFFYGFFSGSVVALIPVIWSTLSDPQLLGTRIGMMTVPLAAGILIGNPVGGGLVHGSNFDNLQIFCGATVIGADVLFAIGRWFHGRTSVTWRV